jgi:hypothetical protein
MTSIRVAAAIGILLTGVVVVEVVVLALNNLRCPLTGVAARYTEDRRDNFDIYLPLLLAHYNKLVSAHCLLRASCLV